jgi:hypothetical protein
MTAVASRRCHYCQRGAPEVFMTRDHIVPRYRVRALRLHGGHLFFGMNLVPACSDCNGLKGYMARMCSCVKCVKAWDVYLVLKALRTPTCVRFSRAA